MLLKLTRVLSLFSPEHPELSVRDISRPFRWPKSTAYRILGRMQQSGFLDRDERTGLYRLGIRLAMYGELARHSTSLQRIAAPALHRLSAETGETGTLMLLNGSDVVTVDVVESYQPLMLPGLLGGRLPLHATAGGKALLGWAPADQQRALLRPPLQRYTSTTITDMAELMRELGRSRKRGYSSVHGEYIEDVVGVAAPIYDHHGDVSAAIAVGGPRYRATPKLEMMAEAVIAAAESVSTALGYDNHLTRPAKPSSLGARRTLNGSKRTTIPNAAPAKRRRKAAPRR